MQFVVFLSEAIIPLLLFLIVGSGLLRHQKVYEDFLDGAKSEYSYCCRNYADTDWTDGCGRGFACVRIPGFCIRMSEKIAGFYQSTGGLISDCNCKNVFILGSNGAFAGSVQRAWM